MDRDREGRKGRRGMRIAKQEAVVDERRVEVREKGGGKRDEE